MVFFGRLRVPTRRCDWWCLRADWGWGRSTVSFTYRTQENKAWQFFFPRQKGGWAPERRVWAQSQSEKVSKFNRPVTNREKVSKFKSTSNLLRGTIQIKSEVWYPPNRFIYSQNQPRRRNLNPKEIQCVTTKRFISWISLNKRRDRWYRMATLSSQTVSSHAVWVNELIALL